MRRLNLGSGEQPLEGWENLDAKSGESAYPLACAPASVDEIRASHLLEHYSHRQIGSVLADWCRALKPGGLLRVAVPDLEVISRAYLEGQQWPIQGYLMGGQVDRHDFHQSAFDSEALTEALRAAGFVGIHRWRSELQDCAALPVSLNLAGWKRPECWPKTSAVMSVPRLGFMDNFFSSLEGLSALGFRLRKTTGAFWGACLTRAIEEALEEESPEYVLTIDYDTIYQRSDVEDLLALATAYGLDAVAPLQAARSADGPLFFLRGEDGKAVPTISREVMDAPLLEVESAHFGLTLLRADALRRAPRPWFLAKPDADGSWRDGRVDEDIHFWRSWGAAGMRVHIAPRIVVGHAELMIRWPDENLRAMHQQTSDYYTRGKPAEAWR